MFLTRFSLLAECDPFFFVFLKLNHEQNLAHSICGIQVNDSAIEENCTTRTSVPD